MNRPEITIQPVIPPGKHVTALLGDGAPVASAQGGWEQVARPKWKAFTVWGGQNAYSMTLPIVLDGFAEDASIEPDLERLRRMMRIIEGVNNEPTVVKVSGPVPLSHLNWVINDIKHDAEIRRDSDGQRVRAMLTLDLLEHMSTSLVVTSKTSPAKKAQEASKKPVSTKTHTVKSGDTLWAIAVKYLGNGNRWKEIQSLNGGPRDPKKLQIGTVLRIP